MEIVLLVVIGLVVVYSLGLFNPIKDIAEVGTRESKVYNRSHKVKVAKRYEDMATDLDVKGINENIGKIDSLKFD